MGRGKALTICATGLVLLAVPGCVTKKTYKTGMEEVDGRVVSVETAVETNQRRVTDLEKDTSAKIRSLEGETDEAQRVGQQALTKAGAAEKAAQGKLLWTVTLSDDEVKFDFGKAKLNTQGAQALDKLISDVKARGKSLYMEIEGHTDSVGPESLNLKLGDQRAQAVRNYLNAKGLPLHAINTISYGESRPVADNTKRDGRAKNRRVVIKVLE